MDLIAEYFSLVEVFTRALKPPAHVQSIELMPGHFSRGIAANGEQVILPTLLLKESWSIVDRKLIQIGCHTRSLTQSLFDTHGKTNRGLTSIYMHF